MGEQLTVDDLARAAMFSKFHFTRMFQRVTGVSPARFLSALRLQRAKDLLVSTTMNVADISVYVGYNSVGTFSSRFSRSVGMSPTTYRRRAGFASVIHSGIERRTGRPSGARMSLQVTVPDSDDDTNIFIGLFAERIPEGRPVRCAVLDRPGRVTFDAVPIGTWYVLAQAVPAGPAAVTRADVPVSVATHGPVTVHADTVVAADIELRRSRLLDPPVLLALLDARQHALSRIHRSPEPYIAGVA